MVRNAMYFCLMWFKFMPEQCSKLVSKTTELLENLADNFFYLKFQLFSETVTAGQIANEKNIVNYY